MSFFWRPAALRAAVTGALSAAALFAPQTASAGINACVPSTQTTPSPYVDNCRSGKVDFFQRYNGAAGGIEAGWLHRSGASVAFKSDLYAWWRNHAARGEGSEPALYADPADPNAVPGGGFYKRALKYEKSYGIPVGSTTAGNPFILRTRQPPTGQSATSQPPQYLNYSCGNNACSQYAGDIANKDFRDQRIAQMFIDYDAGWYKGLWIDDVPTRNMTTDGSGPYTYGIGQFTPAYSPALGRVMTETDWRYYSSKLLEEIRAYQFTLSNGSKITPFARGAAELLINVKWDPNVVGGGLAGNPDLVPNGGGAVTNYARATVAQADHVDLEGMSHDTNNKGGSSTYSFGNIRDYVNRIHDVGTAVVWDEFSYNPQDAEFGLAQLLLSNAGNDSIGLFNMTPANWWDGYDYDLGKALTHLPTVSGNLVRRDFEKGIVLSTDPDANGLRTALATPAQITLDRDYVDSTGTLYKANTTFSIPTSRTAKVLRVAGSTGNKAGARRTDFLTVNVSSYDLSLTTRRGIAGKRSQSGSVSGTRGTFVGDADADGADEITALDATGAVRIYKTGVGFGQTVPSTPVVSRNNGLPSGTKGAFYADITGDGKADLVSANESSITVDIAVSTGAIRLYTSAIDPSFWGDLGTALVDVTGDRRADLVTWNSNGTVKVAASWISSFKAPVTYLTGAGAVGTTANLACDISGDGRADFVSISGSTLRTSIVSADGTTAAAPTIASGSFVPGESGSTYRCADFDADGDADIVSWGPTRTVLSTNYYGGSSPVPFAGGKVISPADPVAGSVRLIGEFDRQ